MIIMLNVMCDDDNDDDDDDDNILPSITHQVLLSERIPGSNQTLVDPRLRAKLVLTDL